MKKLLFLFIITVGSIYAKPCMTDIYFGNGVWNTEEEGQEGRDELKFFMQYRANSRLDLQKEGIEYDFKHAYNPSESTRNDLLETFYQLKESGQISNNYFQWMFTLLNDDETTEPYQKLQDIISTYNGDAIYMFTRYENESFKKKHNVLLVAHSQGNLFGNKMYTLMNEAQKKKFRMVSVATPANHVMKPGQTSPHVTVHGDYAIRSLILAGAGSLNANVDGVGHTFIGTYLGSSFEARTQIALHVKSAYTSLMQTTTCTEYEFTRVWMPTFGHLNVYGSVDGKDELVGEVTLEQSDALLQNDNKTYRCTSEDSSYWGDDNYVGNNWTYNYKDDKNNSWLPGQYITSHIYLDGVSGTTDTVRKDSQCITISLEKDGDLYRMIYDMFPE